TARVNRVRERFGTPINRRREYVRPSPSVAPVPRRGSYYHYRPAGPGAQAALTGSADRIRVKAPGGRNKKGRQEIPNQSEPNVNRSSRSVGRDAAGRVDDGPGIVRGLPAPRGRLERRRHRRAPRRRLLQRPARADGAGANPPTPRRNARRRRTPRPWRRTGNNAGGHAGRALGDQRKPHADAVNVKKQRNGVDEQHARSAAL